MNSYKILPVGDSAALGWAVASLKENGVVFADEPGLDVTHLLLPVPSFEGEGMIKGGIPLSPLLAQLPKEVCIIGGNLSGLSESYRCIDLLKDPLYVSQNAAITAHCAIRLAMQKLPVTLERLPVVVIGWGRIGKCLARLLRALGADVTVCARKEADRAMLVALGYRALPLSWDHPEAALVFNTAPAAVAINFPKDCLKIDLASVQGLSGEDVIWARGLPGKDAPKSSGQLIAETVIPIVKKE